MEVAKGEEAESAGGLTTVLDTIWNGVVLADSGWNPETSCFDLAADYRRSGKTPLECAENFIGWQTAKATAAGFALGLPGLTAMVATVPADLASTAYLQLRMVAVIGLLFGWDVRSDQFRSMAYISLLGSAGGEVLRDFGITFTTKLAAAQLSKLSGNVLIRINQAVGFRLIAKGGSKAVVNLTKIVPVLGGIVGGGINYVVTKQIGETAVSWLKDGPRAEGASAEQGETTSNGNDAVDPILGDRLTEALHDGVPKGLRSIFMGVPGSSELSCPACQSTRYAKQRAGMATGVGSGLLRVARGLGATQPAGSSEHTLLNAVGSQFDQFTCLDCGKKW